MAKLSRPSHLRDEVARLRRTLPSLGPPKAGRTEALSRREKKVK